MDNNLSFGQVEHYANDAARGSLRGSLADIGVSQILNLIHIARKTGTLRFYEPTPARDFFGMATGLRKNKLVPGKEYGAIAFRNGSVVRASTSDVKGHLADILHRANKIDTAERQLILD